MYKNTFASRIGCIIILILLAYTLYEKTMEIQEVTVFASRQRMTIKIEEIFIK